MKFDDLVEIVARLRGPDGCPWDREQTRQSLRKYLIEEFYELIDALDDNDSRGMEEELGDLLFQIVIQSRLSEEEGSFNIHDVVRGIAEKMIQRHPHVFGDKVLDTADDVSVWWEENKKARGKGRKSAIGGVPRSMPALLRARDIQIKASEVGFDWDNIEDVFKKLHEELGELRDAMSSSRKEFIKDELGDLFFVMVRIANAVKVDPEDALHGTIEKFTRRFSHIETSAEKSGGDIRKMTLEEMEVLWNEAKSRE